MVAPGVWVLAVDFGTTNTVAAVGDTAGVSSLTIDARPVLASAVFLNDTGKQGRDWTVGDMAVRLSRHRLERFEARPKREIPNGVLYLGGQNVPVTEAIAALFRLFLQEALRQRGGRPPTVFMVTYPATWTESRVQVLLDAATLATKGLGRWPRPHPLTEPEAAAQIVLHIDTVPRSARIVVLDIGGGTADVTVVDRTGDALTIVGRPTGRDSLGGEDFDLRLADWMTAEAGAAGLYDRLVDSTDPQLREIAADIRNHARAVKEELSKQAVVHGHLPRTPPDLPDDTPVQVSQTVLEQLIRHEQDGKPGLEQAVELVTEALRDAPPGPALAGVFLVGGSSRIPLLGTLINERVGVRPISHLDPTTAVAHGAASFALKMLRDEEDQVQPAAAQQSTVDKESERRVPAPVPPPRSVPPANRPAATPPPRRKSRGKRIAMFLGLLAIGTAAGAYVVNHQNSSSEESSSPPTGMAYDRCADGRLVPVGTSCTTTTARPTSTRQTTNINKCGAPSQSGCTATILATSKDVWPTISGMSDCTVEDGTWLSASFDKFTTACATSTLGYEVIWRNSSAAGRFPVVDLYQAATDASTRVFKLTDSDEVLGEAVAGLWTDDSGREVYSCVREYRDFPVALVISGPGNSATETACSQAVFSGGSKMRAVLG